MSHPKDIYIEALAWVKQVFTEQISDNYLYHSFNHSLNVVRDAEVIAGYSGLESDKIDVMKLAALFHDIGHTVGHDNHEQQSAKIAGEYLVAQGLATEDIRLICDAILDTKVPQNPRNLYSEILCDADLFYLAGDDFLKQAELLRKEWGLTGQGDFSKRKFYEISLRFFDKHFYFTDYTLEHLSQGKEKNRRIIMQMLEELDE